MVTTRRGVAIFLWISASLLGSALWACSSSDDAAVAHYGKGGPATGGSSTGGAPQGGQGGWGQGGSGGAGAQGGAAGTAGSAQGIAGTAGDPGDAGTVTPQDGAAGDASGKSIGTLCKERCEHYRAASCASKLDPNKCLKECVSEFSAPGCEKQAVAELLCETDSTNPVQCDSQGVPYVAECQSEAQSFLECAICAPSSGDDACDKCLKSNCCTERQAVVTAPGFAAWYECVVNCGKDRKCFEGCGKSYPQVEKEFRALKACSDAHCANDCR